MELHFGTTNPAKIKQMQLALRPLGITVLPLMVTVEVNETGSTPVENASIKAAAMASVSGSRVLATDDALRFIGVGANEQPGVNVRRIPGYEARPTDEEMLDYYSALFTRHGGSVDGHWEFAAAVALPDGTVRTIVIETPARRFVANPCKERVPGFPLASLQVDPATGMYLAQMSLEQTTEWWQRSIGELMREFLARLELA
jgi:inosine/xanthosine triphosphate pyrophosphatase family protein